MKPAGVTQKTKDHSKKHPRMAEEWQKGKRIGRPKQVWIVTDAVNGGHWEKR